MNVKNFILIATVISFLGCSKTETDEYLLELDKKTLAENINYDKIVFYKFAKIAIRSSAVQDTSSASYQTFAKNSTHLFKSLNNINIDSGKSISAVDALLIYQDYRKVKKFVKETDEDIFPTVIEGFNKVYGDKNSLQTLLGGEAKIYHQNVEHAILSVATLAAKSLGPEFALYECSKTQPETLKDSEEKTLLEFIRGFLFLNNNLLYLSEDGFSRNIKWLEQNKQIPLPFTKAFFGWRSLSNDQANTAFHAMNCLFRGIDRLKMKREIDEERALDDFELFVKDADELGLESELVWSVESYLYLKREKPAQAIASLNKLKASKILGNDEREAIQESVNYLKDRKNGDKLNTVYDKTLMAKIATRYVFATLKKIDWEKVLQQQGIPHTREVFATLRKYEEIADKVSNYTNEDAIDKGKKTVKEQGGNLLNKAKDFLK